MVKDRLRHSIRYMSKDSILAISIILLGITLIAFFMNVLFVPEDTQAIMEGKDSYAALVDEKEAELNEEGNKWPDEKAREYALLDEYRSMLSTAYSGKYSIYEDDTDEAYYTLMITSDVSEAEFLGSDEIAKDKLLEYQSLVDAMLALGDNYNLSPTIHLYAFTNDTNATMYHLANQYVMEDLASTLDHTNMLNDPDYRPYNYDESTEALDGQQAGQDDITGQDDTNQDFIDDINQESTEDTNQE